MQKQSSGGSGHRGQAGLRRGSHQVPLETSMSTYSASALCFCAPPKPSALSPQPSALSSLPSAGGGGGAYLQLAQERTKVFVDDKLGDIHLQRA